MSHEHEMKINTHLQHLIKMKHSLWKERLKITTISGEIVNRQFFLRYSPLNRWSNERMSPPPPALWTASPRNPTGCSPGKFDGTPPPPPERKSWSESRRSQLRVQPPYQHSAGNISLHSSFDISYLVVMISWELIDKQKLLYQV